MIEEEWLWAAASDPHQPTRADNRFVIAQGEEAFWRRVRSDIDPDERCAWMSFLPTLEGCFRTFITGREMHGAAYNRVVLELAQVPAFARFLNEASLDLRYWVANPTEKSSLPRERYDLTAERQLRTRVAATLGATLQSRS